MSDRQHWWHRRRAGRGPNGSARAGQAVAVIGLGRFGSHVAESLIRTGHEVLAVDNDLRVVQKWADQFTYVAEADATDREALEQLGLADFARVVVAVGSTVEASVLCVLALTEMGIPEIWARAVSSQHAKILTSVGANHVVFPEAAMGERVAHMIISKLLDLIELDETFAIAKTRAPSVLVGRRLSEIGIVERRGVLILGVRHPDGRFEPANPDVIVTGESILIVEGSIDQVQAFSSLG